ncbi:DUF4381 domain-containing protein [Labrenzia sp. VG12]|uniref:DUF4381 domain-containing protein n=1 Tax=Labrenzia sp. VG12 TaxID=2021862 RepID=UPI000B8BDE5B|nr:DUF4381 domain-containing protein [Labrenzia sp. VG12]ASP33500.1 hypothetical protein CHH27_09780 [Labrenzia sp. VG12]
MSDTGTNPVTLVDLLDRLAEPADPGPVSMVPQTWGWIALAILFAFGLAAILVRLLRRYRANAYRREALAELTDIAENPADIACLLRRTALAAFPRQDVAALTGPSWIDFLTRTGRDCTFDGNAAEALLGAPYRATPQPSPELTVLAERWIRTHRREVPA